MAFVSKLGIDEISETSCYIIEQLPQGYLHILQTISIRQMKELCSSSVCITKCDNSYVP